MSDTNDNAGSESEDSDLVKRLRSEIKQRDDALTSERQQRTSIERQQAFMAAGVDPTEGPGRLLFEAYDGEANVESVRSKMEEYGLTSATPKSDSEEKPSYTDQERAAMQLMDDAAKGEAPDGVPEDPQQAASTAFDREMNKTGSRDKAMAASFNARMIAKLEQQRKGSR